MKNSFNLKFSILVGILTFTIAIIVGFYSNSISQKQLEINSGESLVKLSKRVNDILDREMLERYREIKFAASLPEMTSEKSSIDEKREFIEKIKNLTVIGHSAWLSKCASSSSLFKEVSFFNSNVLPSLFPNKAIFPFFSEVLEEYSIPKPLKLF